MGAVAVSSDNGGAPVHVDYADHRHTDGIGRRPAVLAARTSLSAGLSAASSSPVAATLPRGHYSVQVRVGRRSNSLILRMQ